MLFPPCRGRVWILLIIAHRSLRVYVCPQLHIHPRGGSDNFPSLADSYCNGSTNFIVMVYVVSLLFHLNRAHTS